ncbi:hypothetical protein AC579_9339 [Pseudocercospora musae]|uniref:Uncharacterized protein n=1 Tax=Pseudocercospora musae TaxID=113226 RepID=A0A139HZA3_9PEZI|nr:hypothetical protein AC579_9339 [Pseudocercospora musae]
MRYFIDTGTAWTKCADFVTGAQYPADLLIAPAVLPMGNSASAHLVMRIGARTILPFHMLGPCFPHNLHRSAIAVPLGVAFCKGWRVATATTALGKQGTATNILSLPNELLDIVASEIEGKSDILNLRLTNRRLGAAATRSLQTRSTEIHLEACHSSIERFKRICQCPALAAGIKCIIYILPQYEKSTSYMRSSNLLLQAHDKFGIQPCEDDLERYAKYQAEAVNALAEVIWATQPSFEGSMNHFPSSFNRDQRWNRGVHWPGDQDEALTTFPLDGLWNMMMWHMQHSSSYDCANLIAVLECFTRVHPGRLLRIACTECPYVAFSDHPAAIAREEPAQMSFDLSRIGKLSLATGLYDKSDWTVIEMPSHDADKTWSDLYFTC